MISVYTSMDAGFAWSSFWTLNITEIGPESSLAAIPNVYLYQPHFPCSTFTQRCFSNSPEACFLTQYSTTLLASVHCWDEMYHDFFLVVDLKLVSDDEVLNLKWEKNTVDCVSCGLPVCLFGKKNAGLTLTQVNQHQSISFWAGIQTLDHSCMSKTEAGGSK